MNVQCGVERTAACGERVNCETGAETCGPEVVRGQETRAQQAAGNAVPARGFAAGRGVVAAEWAGCGTVSGGQV